MKPPPLWYKRWLEQLDSMVVFKRRRRLKLVKPQEPKPERRTRAPFHQDKSK